jgi:hypothetical protein
MRAKSSRADNDHYLERYRKLLDTTLVTADKTCRILQRTLAQSHWVDLGSRGTLNSSWFCCDTASQGGVPDRPGVAEAQRDKEDAI